MFKFIRHRFCHIFDRLFNFINCTRQSSQNQHIPSQTLEIQTHNCTNSEEITNEVAILSSSSSDINLTPYSNINGIQYINKEIYLLQINF